VGGSLAFRFGLPFLLGAGLVELLPRGRGWWFFTAEGAGLRFLLADEGVSPRRQSKNAVPHPRERVKNHQPHPRERANFTCPAPDKMEAQTEPMSHPPKTGGHTTMENDKMEGLRNAPPNNGSRVRIFNIIYL